MRRIQLVAIGSGIATFFLTLTMAKNMQAPVTEEIVREHIVVAAADIVPYTEISEGMLLLKEVEADSIHPDAIRDMAEAVGRISITTILEKEPILSAKIDEKESLASGLSLQISPGKRAISIIVGVDTGVANNLRVGNQVDILATLPSDLPEDALEKYSSWVARYPELFDFLTNSSSQLSEESNQKKENIIFSFDTVPKVLTLIQRVKVLSLDEKFLKDYYVDQEGGNYTSVTLEVTPEQAMTITLAEEYQQVRLILRNETDYEVSEISGITLQDLLQEDEREE